MIFTEPVPVCRGDVCCCSESMALSHNDRWRFYDRREDQNRMIHGLGRLVNTRRGALPVPPNPPIQPAGRWNGGRLTPSDGQFPISRLPCCFRVDIDRMKSFFYIPLLSRLLPAKIDPAVLIPVFETFIIKYKHNSIISICQKYSIQIFQFIKCYKFVNFV